MIIQSIRGDNYIRAYDLICDICGDRAVYQGTIKECKAVAQDEKWENHSKCHKCNLKEWKEVGLKE